MIDGLLGKKLGMTQRFSEDGTLHAVTVIQAGPCTVVQVKTPERDGYQAVQIGFDKPKRLNKPKQGHLKDLGEFRHLREVGSKDFSGIEEGATIDVSIFESGEKVDVIGTSKGKGFAGVVKRYHFGGGPKTHGQSDRHRAPGSVGAGTTPGRVTKGFKMAGHMGNERVTSQNLTVMEADPQRNILLLRGSVPGPQNGLVLVQKRQR